MQVQMSTAPASTVFAGERVFFCSDHCHTRFEESPSRFTDPAAALAQSE
jgi:YHS domain-containing protein